MTVAPRLAAALAVGLLALAATVSADDPAPAASPPEARQLLDEVGRAYKGLDAYADQGKSTLMMQIDGQTKQVVTKASLAFVRPNLFDLDLFGEVRLVSDGKQVTALHAPQKKYLMSPAPKAADLPALAEVPFPGGNLGSLFDNLLAMPVGLVLDLLVGKADDTLLKDPTGLRLEADRAAGGRTLKCLFIDHAKKADCRLWIDPKTKLLDRVEILFDPQVVKLPDGRHPQEFKVVWTPGAIKKEVSKAAFFFEPPGGYAKFVPGQESRSDQPKVVALVGKPAPEFALTVLDGPGKTKVVRKADLAGKVILVDFWATWCKPCLMELPEVQKLAERYAADKKDLVVVAISQDEAPSSAPELRALVEQTLGKIKVKLADGSVGKVAVDPEHLIGDAFLVEGFPTLVLIDAHGVVQAAHTGYGPGLMEMVGKQIDTLLDGKPLVEPKADDPEKPDAKGKEKPKD